MTKAERDLLLKTSKMLLLLSQGGYTLQGQAKDLADLINAVEDPLGSSEGQPGGTKRG